MTQSRRLQLAMAFALVLVTLGSYTLLAWTPVSVEDDPQVRMPGTQPGQVTTLESANRCLNCHSGYDPAVEPGTNWQGSMMAQSARDFLFWACLTVAGQDSIWALGRPNAVDICERCHFPKGWLEGRSDPPNASLMTGADYDGVQCDFCHAMYDPFFETTYEGTREGNDWHGYWDETNASDTPSQPAADATHAEDGTLAQAITLFNGEPFFGAGNLPASSTYTENGAGQYFVSPNGEKRASFADANGRHQMLYSRYHKSRYFCSTCHDVSNPALANLGADPAQPLPSELNSAYSYFHVERTFSEFMLSDYGLQGGSAGIGPYGPDQFETSHPNNQIATCQDCHMPDEVGKAADMKDAVNRPSDSEEHPNSGQPVHDLTGGNAWVSYVLASAVPGSPNYDATNDAMLNQGPATLTLDLSQGVGFDPVALLGGVDRAKQQLLQAAAIQNLAYDPASGALSFQVQNQTGHKLISGFPEGRRMFVNIKVYSDETLIYEVNPYDAAAGTLKGLDYPYQPGMGLPDPQPLAAREAYVDELVYEMKPSSALTAEDKTFHFALADGRYKDNRIPPKGFRIQEADERLSVPVWHGANAPDYFSAAEYSGGYDAVALDIPAGADYIEVTLYYQTTSREYIEFLRDEINGTGNLTLTDNGAGGDPAYLIQTDPFFDQLKAWGDTIWQLWDHNKNVPGASPFTMAEASVGVEPPPAVQFTTDVQTVGESVGSVTITVELDETTDDTVTVPFTVSGTATGPGVDDSDHDLSDGTFSIPPDSLTGDVTFQVINDSRYEVAETVIVTLGQPEHATLGSRDTQTITITDDDSPPSLSFSNTAYAASEGGGSTTITVTLSGDTALTATVGYATSDGSAEAGADYTASNGTLTFTPSVTIQSFDVPILNDAEPEGDETLTLTLGQPVSATVGTGSAELTIVDDDGALPTLSIADASANEGNGTMIFILTLSAASGSEVTVDYATANGTGPGGAVAGSDYITKTGTLTIPAGATEGQIPVTLLPDDTFELDETLFLNLSNPANASLSDPQATGTILDDDPQPTVSIGDASTIEGNGSLTFTVTLSAPSGLDVSVDYATANGTGPGGAQAGLDYEATSGTLQIPAGATEGQIPVPLLPDDTFELDETFSLTLSAPVQATLADGLAAGTILDDDPAPVISFSSTAYQVSEASDQATITVTLSGNTALTATVTYASSDGTATAGKDYTSATGILTFAPGTSEQVFPIQILDDPEDEADETVDLLLTGTASATLGIHTAVLAIVDDEGQPTLSIGDASASESEGAMTFSVQLSFASAFDVSVDYATSDGPPGPGGAMANGDYTSSGGRLTIPAGATHRSITVTVQVDSLYEGDEIFTVELSNPENAGLTDASGQGTIVDDDEPPQISFSGAAYEVAENADGSTATITVTLSGATALTATVDYEAGDGTAGEADYGPISGTLSFPPGVITQTFEVALLDDTLDELDETVLLTLTHPSQADLLLAGATLTIADDDLPPEISISDAAMVEAEGLMVFAVGLSTPSGLDVTVEYDTHDGLGPAGATAGADYLGASRVLTLTAGSSSGTVQVLILDDDLYEHDETFTLVLSTPVQATLGDGQATGTIWNVDAAPQIGFSQALYEVDEGSSTVALTVTLSGLTALSATVDYATADGPAPASAHAGEDYESASGMLTFLPGETSHALTVSILDDALAEGDETFVVTLSDAVQAAIGEHQPGIVRILDDEAHRVFLPLVIRGGP